MPNTYTQIHLQLVFAVKYRAAIISPTWKYELYTYLTGIIQNHNHKLIAINGMLDHIHILIGMRPTQSLSKLMQQLKQSSSKWINEKRLTRSRFAWQEGYGAFSYGKVSYPPSSNTLTIRSNITKPIPSSTNTTASLTSSASIMRNNTYSPPLLTPRPHRRYAISSRWDDGGVSAYPFLPTLR